MPPDEPGSNATEHGQHHGMTTQKDAHHEDPPGGSYFATLLALLLGTLLLRGISPFNLRLSIPRPSKNRYLPPIFHPPRGPTPSVLQVFRL